MISQQNALVRADGLRYYRLVFTRTRAVMREKCVFSGNANEWRKAPSYKTAR